MSERVDGARCFGERRSSRGFEFMRPGGAAGWRRGVGARAGNPVRDARLQSGEIVLDVGCGTGIDLLMASPPGGRERQSDRS